MTRDELIAAELTRIGQELSGHDALCPTPWNDVPADHSCFYCDLIAKVREDERKRDHVVMVVRMDRLPQIELFGPETYEDCYKALDQGGLNKEFSWFIKLTELPLFEEK